MALFWTPTPKEDASDGHKALLSACLKGDERAFEDLYRTFAPAVYRHLGVLLGREDDVEDALQQVFAEAFRKLAEFRGQSRFSTWLHGIAVNVALNARRTRRRRSQAMQSLTEFRAQTGEAASGSSDPEERAMCNEASERMQRLLATVSEEKRTAFVLYYVEQLELGEVAQRMGSTPAAAWARIQRTRDALLAALVKEEEVLIP